MQGVLVQKIEIGARLKEERERLGMSQPQFAGLGEVSKRAQITYEKGESTPNADYLAAVAKVGADVQYIVTGVRSSAALAPDEEMLLQSYRLLDASRKAGALGAVAGLQQTEKFQGSMQVFHQAPTGDIAGRDIVKKGKGNKG